MDQQIIKLMTDIKQWSGELNQNFMLCGKSCVRINNQTKLHGMKCHHLENYQYELNKINEMKKQYEQLTNSKFDHSIINCDKCHVSETNGTEELILCGIHRLKKQCDACKNYNIANPKYVICYKCSTKVYQDDYMFID